MRTLEGLDDDHAATAGRARVRLDRRSCIGVTIGAGLWRGRDRRVQETPAEVELLGAVAIGEETVVADAVEAIRKGVHEDAADELAGGEGHYFGLGGLPIVLPAE